MHLLKRPTLPDAVPRLRVGRIASRKCGALGIHLQPQVSPSKCEQSEPEGAEEYHRMYIRQAIGTYRLHSAYMSLEMPTFLIFCFYWYETY